MGSASSKGSFTGSGTGGSEDEDGDGDEDEARWDRAATDAAFAGGKAARRARTASEEGAAAGMRAYETAMRPTKQRSEEGVGVGWRMTWGEARAQDTTSAPHEWLHNPEGHPSFTAVMLKNLGSGVRLTPPDYLQYSGT